MPVAMDDGLLYATLVLLCAHPYRLAYNITL